MTKIQIFSKKYIGYYALVDDFNKLKVLPYKWHIRVTKSGNMYAYSRIDGKLVQMHRFLIGLKNSLVIDHKDNNGLNNQMVNLRVCTKSENNLNRNKSKLTSNKYKGVHYRNDAKKFRAKIEFMGNVKYLGYFSTEEDAAIAYNDAALKLYGEFANLNKILC